MIKFRCLVLIWRKNVSFTVWLNREITETSVILRRTAWADYGDCVIILKKKSRERHKTKLLELSTLLVTCLLFHRLLIFCRSRINSPNCIFSLLFSCFYTLIISKFLCFRKNRKSRIESARKDGGHWYVGMSHLLPRLFARPVNWKIFNNVTPVILRAYLWC